MVSCLVLVLIVVLCGCSVWLIIWLLLRLNRFLVSLLLHGRLISCLLRRLESALIELVWWHWRLCGSWTVVSWLNWRRSSVLDWCRATWLLCRVWVISGVFVVDWGILSVLTIILFIWSQLWVSVVTDSWWWDVDVGACILQITNGKLIIILLRKK